MMLLRTDPSRHRLIFLSIPRDLRASIPGYGESKINAAMQIGGPKLAVTTVSQLTGLPINHVVIVDFGAFKTLIDGVGGIDVNVPRADPVEPLRLPLQDAAALPSSGRAGASTRACST